MAERLNFRTCAHNRMIRPRDAPRMRICRTYRSLQKWSSSGLSFADNSLVVAISSFTDRKLESVYFVARTVAFHVTFCCVKFPHNRNMNLDGNQSCIRSSVSMKRAWNHLVLIYVSIVFDNRQSTDICARIGIMTEPTFLTGCSTGNFGSGVSNTLRCCSDQLSWRNIHRDEPNYRTSNYATIDNNESKSIFVCYIFNIFLTNFYFSNHYRKMLDNTIFS